jgi:hypothetical protein
MSLCAWQLTVTSVLANTIYDRASTQELKRGPRPIVVFEVGRASVRPFLCLPFYVSRLLATQRSVVRNGESSNYNFPTMRSRERRRCRRQSNGWPGSIFGLHRLKPECGLTGYENMRTFVTVWSESRWILDSGFPGSLVFTEFL